MNFRIQGSGAEMTKRAINAMPTILAEHDAYFWFPVHDEAVFLMPIAGLALCIEKIHACMVQPYGNMTVPLESEVSIGRSFGELVKVGVKPTEENINAALQKVLQAA